jgi:hypothetical protein
MTPAAGVETRAATAAAEVLLSAVCALFATWVLLAQTALLLGWSLRTLFVLFDATALAGLALLAVSIRRRAPSWRRPRGPDLGLLIGLSLLCGFLSLGAIRPEVDDVTYAARAVYFLAQPDLPLDLALHDHAFFEAPLEYPLLLAYTAELFWAHLAWLLRIDFLDAYHRIAPFLGGALVPLAWALAIERFTGSPRGAALGSVALCAYLCVEWRAHSRSPALRRFSTRNSRPLGSRGIRVTQKSGRRRSTSASATRAWFISPSCAWIAARFMCAPKKSGFSWRHSRCFAMASSMRPSRR